MWIRLLVLCSQPSVQSVQEKEEINSLVWQLFDFLRLVNLYFELSYLHTDRINCLILCVSDGFHILVLRSLLPWLVPYSKIRFAWMERWMMEVMFTVMASCWSRVAV